MLHCFCFFKWITPPFSPADPRTAVALISCVCIKHPVGSISLCTAPSIWGDGYQFLPQARVRQGHDPHYVFLLFCHSQQLKKRGLKFCQALEGVLCTHCMVGPPHSAVRVTILVPQLIDTDSKANPSRGNEWMDNHLLKRKMLRQLSAMAICILSLISAVPLYCI